MKGQNDQLTHAVSRYCLGIGPSAPTPTTEPKPNPKHKVPIATLALTSISQKYLRNDFTKNVQYEREMERGVEEGDLSPREDAIEPCGIAKERM